MSNIPGNGLARPVILAVDDDTIILNTILSTFSEDYTVIPFTSGTLALQYLDQRTADLILLDINMPVISGVQVLEHINSNPSLSDIPVIFLTGADDDGEVETLNMGAADYVRKPVRPESLRARVNIQLELQRHRKNMSDLVQQKTEDLNFVLNKLKSREGIIVKLLAHVTDIRDNDTGLHTERTAEYVRIITEELQNIKKAGYILSSDDAENIVKSSKMHDLGKIAIPDTILLKPGKLTFEEFEVVKTHTVMGERLFADFIDEVADDPFFITARDIAYLHHEKWDGTGYPLGLKGTNIPLSARIVAVADVYDALTTERPYKPAYTHEESVTIINNDSARHFDPVLVDVFNKREKEFQLISQCKYL